MKKSIVLIVCLMFVGPVMAEQSVDDSSAYKQAHIITFHNKEGEVGFIDWSDGTMKFEGKADESARAFFEYFLKYYVDGYIKEKCK